MSIVRSATVALSTAAFVATLLTGGSAHAAERPTAARMATQNVSSMDTSQRIASGSTTPGQGWIQHYSDSLYIDVNTGSAHFTGSPVYTVSVGGSGSHFALSGTSAVYSPTATGFRVYIRWSAGGPLTVADAQAHQWFINWIGVDNP